MSARFLAVAITAGLGSSKKAAIRTMAAAPYIVTYLFPATNVPNAPNTIPTDNTVVFSTGRKGLGPAKSNRPAAAIIALSGAKIAAKAPTPAAPRSPKAVNAKKAEHPIVQIDRLAPEKTRDMFLDVPLFELMGIP